MNYRDYEAVRQIVENATGLEITYAYDDLVFPEHGAFIIQFDDENTNKLFCYFHVDCTGVDRKTIFNGLEHECVSRKASLETKGDFELKQEGEDIQIHFTK